MGDWGCDLVLDFSELATAEARERHPSSRLHQEMGTKPRVGCRCRAAKSVKLTQLTGMGEPQKALKVALGSLRAVGSPSGLGDLGNLGDLGDLTEIRIESPQHSEPGASRRHDRDETGVRGQS